MLEVVGGIIDGRHWVRTRLRHLEQARDTASSPEAVEAIDAEIAQLRAVQRRGLWRWLRLPHQPNL